MDSINVPVFAQAKLEYTKQLIDILCNPLYDGISSIYNESKKIYSTKTGTPLLNIFRTLLERVPKWNSDIIMDETDRITSITRCDWLDDLVTAVFISHTRILMSIGPNQNFAKINVSIPKTTSFIHKIYINVAREIWKNPYLYNENVPGYINQQNIAKIEEIIRLNIESTIRKELPVKEILREHLDKYESMDKIDVKMLLNEIKKNNITSLDNLNSNDVSSNNDSQENVDTVEESNDIDDSIKETIEDDTNIESDIKETIEDDTNIESDIKENLDKDKIGSEKTQELGIEMKYDNVDLDMEKTIDNIADDKNIDMDILGDEDVQFSSYDSNNDPSPSEIKKQTENIVVNDLTIPVEIDESKNTNIEKESSIKQTIDDPSIKSFSIDKNVPNKIDNIIKEDNAPKDMFSLGGIDENKEADQKTLDVNEKLMKDIATLDKEKDNIDDTETLDNFFQDVKELAQKKDTTIDLKSPREKKYTFFDDAA
jgi:hypothetical protein